MDEDTNIYHHYAGKGIVFNIQRWAIQDGPGMRTTVFLKGCPLHCTWCANPESQKMIPEIMTRDILCIGCGKCTKICPQNAICMINSPDKEMLGSFLNKRSGTNDTNQKKNVIRSIQWTKCNQCMKCSDVCPSKAIIASGKEKSVHEVMDTVIKDIGFYRHSNGGMTISGGEPLMQWRFALDLLKAAEKKGIHTALDTTGFAKWDVLEQLLQHTDLLLYDIKSVDSKKHKDQTGVGNEVIIDNLKRALKMKKVWIRRPIIPGFNDSVDETISLARFISSLNPIPDKISLLPYHKFAESKYESMGKIYTYRNTVPVNEEGILEIKKLLESLCHVAVDIGK
jgi:pyruvate formate lyase activating enzyme